MTCLAPIRIKNPRYKGVPPDQLREYSPLMTNKITPDDYYIDVPCGKCINCKKKKQSEWVTRLEIEYSTSKSAVFVTLTFNEEYYAKFKGNYNKAVQLFLDRLRKCHVNYRYWFIPELGEDFKRLHYHGFFFGTDYIDYDFLLEKWQYGYIWLGYVLPKTFRYCTKYTTKPTKEKLAEHDLTRLPRIVASKGIGLSYINKETLTKHHSSDLPVHNLYGDGRIPLPRYLYNKIFDREMKDYIALNKKDVFEPTEYKGDIYYSESELKHQMNVDYLISVREGLSDPRIDKNYKIKHIYGKDFDPTELQTQGTEISEKSLSRKEV